MYLCILNQASFNMGIYTSHYTVHIYHLHTIMSIYSVHTNVCSIENVCIKLNLIDRQALHDVQIVCISIAKI